jgi:hypothetical protein
VQQDPEKKVPPKKPVVVQQDTEKQIAQLEARIKYIKEYRSKPLPVITVPTKPEDFDVLIESLLRKDCEDPLIIEELNKA